MTPAQIYILIESNGCVCIQLRDYSNNKLHEVTEQTPQAATVQLERDLPKFAGYRKIQVLGKKGDINTPWTKAYTWQLEFPAEETSKSIAAPSQQAGIGVMDYVNLFKDMSEKNYALQKELMEKTLAMKNDDPSKWIPFAQVLGPALGLNVGSIQGPPPNTGTKELHFVADIDYSKMSAQEIGEAIAKVSGSLSTKIRGSEMLKFLVALDQNPNVAVHIEKISHLLQVINKNPGFLDLALNFVNNGTQEKAS